MRRVLLAVFFIAASFGIYVVPSGADNPLFSNVVLSFDYSDNVAAASANVNAPLFNIISDVLPANTGGVVRMVAIPPVASGDSTLVCPFQPVQQGQVECAFNFSTNGVWVIKAQYSIDTKSGVSSISVTSLRVTNQ
jgi:hypothetical protein